MVDYTKKYKWKVKYQRRDGFKFNSIFKTKGKAIEFMRSTLDNLDFDEYVIIKAIEEGYIYSQDREGRTLEMKIVENK